MARGFRALPRRRLQELVGEGLLSRLEVLLPAVAPDASDSGKIYNKRSLEQVVEAFAAADILKSPLKRREIIEHQNERVLDRIVHELDPGQRADAFEDKVTAIAKADWSNEGTAAVLVRELDLLEAILPKSDPAPPSHEIIARPQSPHKPLKDYQRDVWKRAEHQLGIPRNRFVLQMPTGSGKTRVAMELLTGHLNRSGEGNIALWLAHSGELCEQAAVAFSDVWQHLGERDIALWRLWGQHDAIDSVPETGVIISSFQKLYSLVKQGSNLIPSIRERLSFLVVDEAHRAIAPTYKETIKAILGLDTRVMGLTATPGRSAREARENEELSEFFFGTKIGLAADGHDNVIEKLRHDGILAHVDYDELISNRSYELTQKQLEQIHRYFDFPRDFLVRVGNDDVRNAEIIKRLRDAAAEGSRVLLFACSVEHSRFLAGACTFLGIKTAHIDGEISYSTRRALIEGFRNGSVQVLCNYGVLSTGFDVPHIDAIFITRPTASVVLYSQMLGRGLRGPAIGGTDRCRVIDVRDNIVGFANDREVYDYFEEYWA